MTVDCLAQLCVTARLRLILLFRRFQVPLQFVSQAMAAYSCLCFCYTAEVAHYSSGNKYCLASVQHLTNAYKIQNQQCQLLASTNWIEQYIQ